MPSIEQQVRERAYYIWEGEGRCLGRAVDHWLMAEAEFRSLDEAAAQAPLVVQSSVATSVAKSPAKTLKPRAARSASAAAVAVAAKADAKSAAAKTSTAAKKPAAAKAAAAKPKAKSSVRSDAGAGALLH